MALREAGLAEERMVDMLASTTADLRGIFALAELYRGPLAIPRSVYIDGKDEPLCRRSRGLLYRATQSPAIVVILRS